MIVYPSRRLVRIAINVKNYTNNYTATAPLLGVTENTMSTRARARQEDITYYSLPTEFP